MAHISPKSSFINIFDDYTPTNANNLTNKTHDGISPHMQTQLEKYAVSKLHFLTTELASDIFYDNTVYTGSAGLALYYFMSSISKKKTHSETLKNALLYLDITNLKGQKISFLCGDAGPLAIATVISYKLGFKDDNFPDHKTLAQRLMALMPLMYNLPDELLYGKSGYLYALLFVNKHISGKSTIPQHHIEKVVIAILKSGKAYSQKVKSDSPLLWQWHDKVYLGAAHGVAGILYTLLQAHAYVSTDDMRDLIKPTLDWLSNQRYPSGNFQSSLGSTSGDRLVQWCHGAPGFVPLYLLAYELFGEEKYLDIATRCGDITWERGLSTKGYSICHGVSGNAYAFIQLYQATKNPVHLYRACCFMKWCKEERSGTQLRIPDRPASLFEGLIGPLYLAASLSNISEAHFPAYTV